MKNDRTNVGTTKANKYQAGTLCAWIYQKLSRAPKGRLIPIERLLNKGGEGIFLKNVQSTIKKVCKDQKWENEVILDPSQGRVFVKILRRG